MCSSNTSCTQSLHCTIALLHFPNAPSHCTSSLACTSQQHLNLCRIQLLPCSTCPLNTPSSLQPKSTMPATVTVGGEVDTYTAPSFPPEPTPALPAPAPVTLRWAPSVLWASFNSQHRGSTTASVNELAFTRSGDKVPPSFTHQQTG